MFSTDKQSWTVSINHITGNELSTAKLTMTSNIGHCNTQTDRQTDSEW